MLLQARPLLLVSFAQQNHILQLWEEGAAVCLTDTVKESKMPAMWLKYTVLFLGFTG